MEETIENVCNKWISKSYTTGTHHGNSLNDKDAIKLIQCLESLSLTQLKHQSEITKRIYQSQKGTLLYNDQNLQEKALKFIPVGELHAKTQLLVDGGKSFEESLVLTLLKWFKNDFFVWVNSPKCTNCGGIDSVHGIGLVSPTPMDLRFGASRVELHQCKKCKTNMRFPRYNDPLKLLETRCGRCGEWANAFTLICAAMGLEFRYILDLTDHVWTEIFIPKLNRWVHTDPCEEAFDTPLMYEHGWGKQLSFIIALSCFGFTDVTPRYTRKLDQVILKRNIDEISFAKTLSRWTSECRKSVSESLKKELLLRDREEEEELLNFTKHERSLQDAEFLGRQSGSYMWRKARGEHK